MSSIASEATQLESSTATTLVALPKRDVFLFEGLTWREFKATEQLLDRPGFRLSFLDGVMEIRQMPGEPHETFKERIGALVDLYLMMAGFDFTPTGSMTLEDETRKVKREADKSYKLAPGRKYPDLAIEVVVTSGGIDQLEAYKCLRISEVWFWEDGVLDLYHLREVDDQLHYEKITQSEVLPEINMALLSRCIMMTSHIEALRTFQAGL
jgi:Uma2 family endonuclease